MPELPEVESIKIQLEKYLVGYRMKGVDVNWKKILSGDEKKLIGGKVVRINRFGKVLSIDLGNGYSILIHVKLTGQLIYRGPRLKHSQDLSKKVFGGVPGIHTHAVFHLDGGGKLYYNDVRKFGWIKVVKTGEVKNIDFIKKLGPEPLNGLDMSTFKEIVENSSRSIKTLLMDQAKIGGVGNIYANDALWLAKVAPTRSTKSLSDQEIKQLYTAIEKVLKEGLKRGGASELAFVTPDGKEGKYQEHFLVYGREGKPCNGCGAPIEKIKLSGRGTYFCPKCQK